MNDCIAFMSTSFTVNHHAGPRTTATNALRSGRTSIAPDISGRPAGRSSSERCAALMMAKKPKMGKGKGKKKGSRMELIER